MFFVFVNGVTVSFDFLNKQAFGIITCVENEANSIYNAKIIILDIGIGILGLSIAYVIFFVISLTKKINDLWNFFSRLSSRYYGSLKQVYLDRLSILDGINEYDIGDIIIKDKPDPLYFKISFSQVWRYIWRLLIITVLSILFYLIVILLFCTDIENIIKYKPNMINMLSQSNKQIQLMAFYMVEAFCYNSVLSLDAYFPDMINYENPFEKFESLMFKFNNDMNDFRKPEYKEFMPTDIYLLLFNEVFNDTSGFNHFGLYTGMRNAAIELQYVVSTLDYNDFNTIVQLITDIFDIIQSSNLIIDNQLTDNLNNIFNNIIIATVIYSVLSILLYLFLYLPYLDNESKHLKKIQSLVKIVGHGNSSNGSVLLFSPEN